MPPTIRTLRRELGSGPELALRGNMKMTKLPQLSMKCYACDASAVGVRDRAPEGLELGSACARPADPTLQS